MKQYLQKKITGWRSQSDDQRHRLALVGSSVMAAIIFVFWATSFFSNGVNTSAHLSADEQQMMVNTSGAVAPLAAVGALAEDSARFNWWQEVKKLFTDWS